MKMNHFRVIIVGAGSAGIATAARLLENNLKDIVVLEAENRVGGRIFTSEIGGNIVDLGAEFIHGEKDNIVYELASEFNLANTNENCGDIFAETNFYKSGNRQIDKDVSRQLIYLYNKLVYPEPNAIKNPKGSLGDYLVNEYKKGVDDLRKDVNVSDNLAKEFLDVFEKWENSIDASDSWFETSLPGHFEYWECDGNIVTVWDNHGYNTLFDLLDVFRFLEPSKNPRFPKPLLQLNLKNVQKKPPYGTKQLNIMEKIKLNKKVKSIKWNKKGNIGVRNVSVECEDGSTFTSDYIVSTFSLGVLKDNAENMFSPPLSVKKLNAIRGLGFGTVNKIFLKFSHPWWRDDEDGFAFLWSEEERKEDLSGWMSDIIAFHPVRRGSSILRGWIVGEPARHFETIPESEVLDGCMEVLNRFMGFKYAIPRAEALSRTRWFTNPHFRGSYSCRLVESDKRDVWASDLAEPEFSDNGKPLLLFAGEATHDHFFSTVHGAVESGRREANRLLKYILNTSYLKNSYEVAIVGAGISGLAAAKVLQDEGITDVIVLEAQESPGGRIKSIKVGENWLELGAQWIHGDKNKMFKICRDRNLVTDKYSDEGQGLYLRENGTIIDEQIVYEVDDFIKTTLENCEEYVSFENKSEIPSSVGEELTTRFNEYLNRCNDSDDMKELKKDLFCWHVRFHLIDNSCSDLKNLSAKAWGLYRFCGGHDYINFKNGYKSLVDALITDIPKCTILCSSPVTAIEWSEHLSLNSCMNGAVSSERNKKFYVNNCAKVICGDKISINANYVIVTSSLGYLKNNHKKMFRPPLPSYLTEAINCLGFGVLGKIFLIYNEPWWEPDVKGFQLVWPHKKSSDTGKRHWSVDVTGFDVIIENGSVLLGWVGGEGAKIIENMSESELGYEATEVLRQFTGNRDIPVPDRVLKSEWFNNEFIKGGYSHITVDYDKNGIDGSSLSIPVYTNIRTNADNIKKPTILLAGEAVHQTHFSTVHGAYESGVNQARVVVNDIKCQY